MFFYKFNSGEKISFRRVDLNGEEISSEAHIIEKSSVSDEPVNLVFYWKGVYSFLVDGEVRGSFAVSSEKEEFRPVESERVVCTELNNTSVWEMYARKAKRPSRLGVLIETHLPTE